MEDKDNCTTELFLLEDGGVEFGETDGPLWTAAVGQWQVIPGTDNFKMDIVRKFSTGTKGRDMGEFDYEIVRSFVGEMTEVGDSVGIAGVMHTNQSLDGDDKEVGFFSMIDVSFIDGDKVLRRTEFEFCFRPLIFSRPWCCRERTNARNVEKTLELELRKISLIKQQLRPLQACLSTDKKLRRHLLQALKNGLNTDRLPQNHNPLKLLKIGLSTDRLPLNNNPLKLIKDGLNMDKNLILNNPLKAIKDGLNMNRLHLNNNPLKPIKDGLNMDKKLILNNQLKLIKGGLNMGKVPLNNNPLKPIKDGLNMDKKLILNSPLKPLPSGLNMVKKVLRCNPIQNGPNKDKLLLLQHPLHPLQIGQDILSRFAKYSLSVFSVFRVRIEVN